MHLPHLVIAGNAKRVGIGECGFGGAASSFRATLGSCVGLCLLQPSTGRIGLAHVLLPYAADSGDEPGARRRTRYAETVVPYMLDEFGIDTRRARRELVAYVAGGASMFRDEDQRQQVGQQNRVALVEALRTNRVRVVGEDFGGEDGRTLVVHGPTRQVLSISLSDRDHVLRWEFPPTFQG